MNMATRNTDLFSIVLYFACITIVNNSLITENREKGVCKRTEVVRKLRLFTYNKWVEENYRDPDCLVYKCTLKRRVQRTFHKYKTGSEPKLIFQCCPGYEQVNQVYYEELKCAPTCSSPCKNGTCTGPEECTCDPGYQLDPSNKYACIPVCKKTCGNDESCFAPDECGCKIGYIKDYNEDCQPVCDIACPINSICIAPNRCECSPGYTLSNKSYKCVPICSLGCSNGKCVGPDNCICNHGYEMQINNDTNIGTCQPICKTPCINGKCVAPNICKCSSGYKLIRNNTCVPDCSKTCKNGKCIGPGVCQCLKGYKKDHEGVCKPICNIKCVNGFCVSPEKCTCSKGWRLKETINSTDKICEPICRNPCINGKCIAPDKCSCLKGYMKIKEKRENITYEICQPHCSKGCSNGTCVGPEKCKCNDGWTLHKIHRSKVHTCIPKCKEYCVNGLCVAPDTCECFPGYKKSKNVSAHNICEPHCTSGCSKGTCISPEICICDKGWHLTTVNQAKLFKCSQNCQKACPHGLCVLKNSCECLPIESFVCGPHCPQGCPNGRCMEPETCVCNKGYAMIEDNHTRKKTCQPVCTKPCINSKCVAPDICECLPGYVKLTELMTNITYDIKMSVNSSCKDLKTMGKDNNTCLPVCDIICNNGTCNEPNTCKCLPGYKKCADNVCKLECSAEYTIETGTTTINTTTANAIIDRSTNVNLRDIQTNRTRVHLFGTMQWINYHWFYLVIGAVIGSFVIFLLIIFKKCGQQFNTSDQLGVPPAEFALDFITQPRWTFVRTI